MEPRQGEDALVAAIAAGRDDAFDELYERFARPLYTLGLRWLGDLGDAEELVHDTLVRAWRQADRFDPARGRVATWLFAIARHIAIDRLRARRGGGEQLPEDLPTEMDVDGLANAWDVAVCLDRLPPVQREVLVLAYRHGLSQSEIAGVLGIPLGTVKSRTYHALRQMARLLQPPVTGPAPSPDAMLTEQA